jgi:Flp pilus assembly protein protease CpaA
MIEINIVLAFIALVIGSFTDIKTREVPDWLSYSLIISGFAISGIFSILNNNIYFILNSLIGFAIALIFALIMFYTGQWGGGDSKLLIAIGTLMGSSLSIFGFVPSFIINTLLIGAVYGILWGLIISIKKRKIFAKKAKKILKNKRIKILKKVFFIISLTPFLALIIKADIIVFMLCSILFISFNAIVYVYIMSKIFEEAFMYKYVNPKELTEGDWIAEDIKIKGKEICNKKDLGVSKKQIRKLIKSKIKEVKIKEGLPFVPSFLIAFILTILFGNFILLLI